MSYLRPQAFLFILASILAVFTVTEAYAEAGPADEQIAIEFVNVVSPKIQNYCMTCHSGANPKKGLSFEHLLSVDSFYKKPAVWKEVASRLEDDIEVMPPWGVEHRPTDGEVKEMSAMIKRALPMMERRKAAELAAPEAQNAEPKLALRRLNRAEYLGTLTDIFDEDFGVEEYLPDDPIGKHGFDNTSESLGVSSILLSKYLLAAERIAKEITTPPLPQVVSPYAGYYGSVNQVHKKTDIVTCIPANESERQPCLRKILQPVLERLHRRTYSDADLDKFIATVEKKQKRKTDDFRKFVARIMTSALISSDFLFRFEMGDPQTGKLSPMELAHRLSFFLWSRPPDAILLNAVKKGMLDDPWVLRHQVQRMMKDPKFDGFVENFGGYWLGFRLVSHKELEKSIFPEFVPEIRADMRLESKLFFKNSILNGKGLSELVNSRETYLNPRLAAYYGLPARAVNDIFEAVDVSGAGRGGILTQGAFLAVSSGTSDTSPVKRGKWVLENLLCSAPPPPPAGINANLNDPALENLNSRQKLEHHRKNPICASCHTMMDPPGLALENFGASGRWRASYFNAPIEINEMFNGRPVRSVQDLKNIIVKDPRFYSCFVKTLLSYGLGRGVDAGDKRDVEEIIKRSSADGHKLQDIIIESVFSKTFTHR